MSPKTPEPLTYLLRDIDADLWARFRARAESEGVAMRTILLTAARAYVDGEIELTARRPRGRKK